MAAQRVTVVTSAKCIMKKLYTKFDGIGYLPAHDEIKGHAAIDKLN